MHHTQAQHFFKAGTRSAGVNAMMCSVVQQLAERLPSAKRKLDELLKDLEPEQLGAFTALECFEK
jgi:hypothetical protein